MPAGLDIVIAIIVFHLLVWAVVEGYKWCSRRLDRFLAKEAERRRIAASNEQMARLLNGWDGD